LEMFPFSWFAKLFSSEKTSSHAEKFMDDEEEKKEAGKAPAKKNRPVQDQGSGEVQEKKRLEPITAKKAERLLIWAGVDFGTSFTKVAYRVLGGNRRVFPAAVSPNSEMPYALPSLLAFDGRKVLYGDAANFFLRDKPWNDGVRYLKILFAGDVDEEYRDDDLDARFREYCDSQVLNMELLKPGYMVAAYLAWVFRRIKNCLGKKFEANNITYNFNVCLPIDTFEKENVRREFQRAINAASALEKDWDGENGLWLLEKAAALWDCTAASEPDGSTVHLVPEAVAQMASYVNSLSAENKIHGVIDFGAGTTDFSIFNLCEDVEEGKCAFWYNAITFPGGMERVESSVARLFEKRDAPLDYPKLQSVMANIAREKQEIRQEVKEQLETIWEKSRFPAWGAAYKKRKQGSEWKRNKVKVFVCGGGSGLPYVKEIFGRSWYEDSWGPYEVVSHFSPSDFGGRPEDFSRLSVAYGLTFPRPELQKYVLPKDCPDQTPAPLPRMADPDGSWGPVYADIH